MNLRRFLHSLLWQWRLYGIPRCHAYFFDEERQCGRLMWPWQTFGGNGEEARHAVCQERENRTFEDQLTDEAAA